MQKRQRELKFVFPNSHAQELQDWLDGRCEPDPEFSAGRIFSLYFDTLDGALADEKINSDYLKTKVRLRWYGDWTTGAAAGAVYLEVKQREGGRRRKFRRPLDWAAADLERWPLNDPRLLAVNEWTAAAGFFFPGPLRPVIRIAYRRRRYLEPVTQTRICLDRDILSETAGFTGGPPGAWPPLPEGVFEVKGEAFSLPDSLHPLISRGCRRQSFSKFVRCLNRHLAPRRELVPT